MTHEELAKSYTHLAQIVEQLVERMEHWEPVLNPGHSGKPQFQKCHYGEWVKAKDILSLLDYLTHRAEEARGYNE